MLPSLNILPQGLLRSMRYCYHLCRIGSVFDFLNELKLNYVIPKIKKNYLRILLKRKTALKQPHILFLVNDSSKWKLQSVYAFFHQRGFKVSVVISLYGWMDSREKAEKQARVTFDFFKKRSMNVFYAYDFSCHQPIGLENFSPDFVFYEQPWDIFPVHMPYKVSRYALTAYVSYDIPCTMISKRHCALPFHRQLFVQFVMNKKWGIEIESFLKSRKTAAKIIVAGHPAFDEYQNILSNESNRQKEGTVIYAPHWAFPHKNNPNMFDVSTFLWSGYVVLEYAKSHPEINWVFKPHPVLKSMLLKSGVMSTDEVEQYYNSWEKIGKCCFSSDYTGLFMQSYVLITDSMSFLLEYGCTGKPIIHLVSQEQKVKFSNSYSILFDLYYKVFSPEDLDKILRCVIEKREDPNFCRRKQAIEELGFFSGGGSACKKIGKYCESLLIDKKVIIGKQE